MRAVLCLALCAVAVTGQGFWGGFNNYYNGGYGGYGAGYGAGYGYGYSPYAANPYSYAAPYAAPFAAPAAVPPPMAPVATTATQRFWNILNSYPANYPINANSFRQAVLGALQVSTIPASSKDSAVFAKLAPTGVQPASAVRAFLSANPVHVGEALGLTKTCSISTRGEDIKKAADLVPATACRTDADCDAVSKGAARCTYSAGVGNGRCVVKAQCGQACGMIPAAVSKSKIAESYYCAPGLSCVNTVRSPPPEGLSQCVDLSGGKTFANLLNNQKTVAASAFWTQLQKSFPNAVTMMTATDLEKVMAAARGIATLTPQQKTVVDNLFAQLAFPQTTVPAHVVSDFFNRNPAALAAMVGAASNCEDSATFNAGWGKCDTYKVGQMNHPFCRQDGADAACPVACGTCGSTAGVAPPAPFAYAPPAPFWG